MDGVGHPLVVYDLTSYQFLFLGRFGQRRAEHLDALQRVPQDGVALLHHLL